MVLRRGGDGHAPLIAERQRSDQLVGEPLVGPRRGYPRNPEDLGVEFQVLCRGEIEVQREVLRDIPSAPPLLPGREPAKEPDLARAGCQQPQGSS
jgi:hypothetical protein